MCYIYLRFLFGIAYLTYHTTITFALYQPLYPEFIGNSFDIKRAAATFAQFACILHGKHKCIYPGNEYADILCLTNLPCLKERRDSLCTKYFQNIMETTHRLNYLLPCQRCNKYDVRRFNKYPLPEIRTNRYRNSLIPWGLYDWQYVLLKRHFI